MGLHGKKRPISLSSRPLVSSPEMGSPPTIPRASLSSGSTRTGPILVTGASSSSWTLLVAASSPSDERYFFLCAVLSFYNTELKKKKKGKRFHTVRASRLGASDGLNDD